MRRLPAWLLPLLALVAFVVAGCGSGSTDDVQERRLDVIRRATRIYQDPNAALARGYIQAGCIEASDGSGGLGTLFFNGADAGRHHVDLVRPQLLFYDLNVTHPGPRLLGVGYYQHDDGQRPPETALGHMEGPLPQILPGQGSHFELHAWVFRENPDGVLSFWNSDVGC